MNKTNDKATKGQYQAIGILGIAMLIVGTMLYIKATENPLIGKWQGNISMMGNQKIEFRKERVIFMGITSKVEYEKNGNEIIVTDATGIGTIYKIIDKNTIKWDLNGVKAVFKRIE